jgi:phage baseplate assembly protein W
MTYLRWPMRVGVDGRFETTATPDMVWGNRVSQVLSARMGERVMRSDYGLGLAEFLFETSLGENPEETVRAAVQRWLPNIRVDEVHVEQRKETWNIEVLYTTPDGSQLTTTVGVGNE